LSETITASSAEVNGKRPNLDDEGEDIVDEEVPYKSRHPINPLTYVPWHIKPRAAPGTAKRLLAAVEAPAIARETLDVLQAIAEKHGEEHLTLVLRTIVESDGNRDSLFEPIIGGVSSAIIFNPEHVAKGLAWIEAFDQIPLRRIFDLMRELEYFRKSEARLVYSTILQNKLRRIFEGDRPPPLPAKRKYRKRPPRSPQCLFPGA
jgi:hypothetical protein